MKITIKESVDGFHIEASNGLQTVAEQGIHYELDGGIHKLTEFFKALGFEAEYEEDY